MIGAESFICPRCARICFHPLEVYFRWCPECKAVTGMPRACEHPPPDETAAQVIRNNQDDCLIAIERRQPLPTKALQSLPPYRATMMANVARLAAVGLEQGTYEQIWAEASSVGGEGKLGDWWTREV